MIWSVFPADLVKWGCTLGIFRHMWIMVRTNKLDKPFVLREYHSMLQIEPYALWL